ncbi:hypothetical protein BDZ97DRAFT_1428413 [Flammula alnicola]|nr:hypothetical protein BDZ97DRAFT_1428413 [Flammula alnicola]
MHRHRVTLILTLSQANIAGTAHAAAPAPAIENTGTRVETSTRKTRMKACVLCESFVRVLLQLHALHIRDP